MPASMVIITMILAGLHTPDTGLIDFKKKVGTVETKLYYSNYPTKSNSLSENRGEYQI